MKSISQQRIKVKQSNPSYLNTQTAERNVVDFNKMHDAMHKYTMYNLSQRFSVTWSESEKREVPSCSSFAVKGRNSSTIPSAW